MRSWWREQGGLHGTWQAPRVASVGDSGWNKFFQEMKSMGEAIYFIQDLKDPFFRQVYGERSMYLSR
jgi:hypothetical protein